METSSAASRRITAISPDPARPWAVRITVDGKLYCTVATEVLGATGAAVGSPLDAALAERLGASAEVEAAYRTALRALGQRAHARADLARRLRRKGHPPEAVEAALDRASAAGYLDDAGFARQFTQSRAARGRGPGRILRDLLALGVARPLIEAALAAEWPPEADPLQQARHLAHKRAVQLAALDPPVAERRLLAFLARRGFGGGQVLTLVREALRAARRQAGAEMEVREIRA